MRTFFLIMVAILLASAGQRVSGADTGESVAVVYNLRLPESKKVAEHYARLRGVPARQILGLDLPLEESISRAEFREKLEKPIAKWLESTELFNLRLLPDTPESTVAAAMHWRLVQSRIRYLVLCYGVPVRILPDATLKEEGIEKIRPELRRTEAAVDSDLALLPMLDFKPRLTGPLPNSFYALTNAFVLQPTNGLLMVARLDGPSAAIAQGLVDKALQGETNGLWGRAYFDLRGITNGEYKTGDDWLRQASEFSRQLGFETIVDERPETFPAGFPLSQIAFYAGWYDGEVSGPFKSKTVEFVPGAFAYHLHSFSAAKVRSANQHWVGPLLAKGATITMGCVDEPYLAGTPDIGTFFGRFVGLRFSFGEAAYVCQPVLSWQTTVIGDPLYRPFGEGPQQLHEALKARDDKLLEWSYLRVVNLNLARKVPPEEAIAYLIQQKLTATSAVLSEKLGDMFLLTGKTNEAWKAYGNALSHHSSPLQGLRIGTLLADQFMAAGKSAEAFAVLRPLPEKIPNYPDLPSLYERLAELASKLGKATEAELYRKEILSLETKAKPAP